jgi:hypothetical protein
MSSVSNWLSFSPTSGSLVPGAGSTVVTASVTAAANTLPRGLYNVTVLFTNLTTQTAQFRTFQLRVGQLDYFTELFSGTGTSTNDLAYHTLTLTPDASSNRYSVCIAPATSFPTDPTGGVSLTLGDDDYSQVTLSGTNTVAIYDKRTNVFFIGSNGYLTLTNGDRRSSPTLAYHFALPRVSAYFDDLDPSAAGTVSWQELADRAVVSYVNVPEAGPTGANSFQVELFFDGRIRITWLGLTAVRGLAGISAGGGLPFDYLPSDLTTYGACPPPPPSFVSGSLSVSGGVFQATLSGQASAYEIQYSSNLASWYVLGNVTMTNGVGTVTDNSPGTALRFYRARALP